MKRFATAWVIVALALGVLAHGRPLGAAADAVRTAGLGLRMLGLFLALLIAIDTIPDMFKTLFNVTADMVVAVILSRGRAAEA